MTDSNTPLYTPKSSGDIRHSHHGPILGILIIVLVIIGGGMFLWGSMLFEKELPPPPPPLIVNHEPETPRATADIEILNTTSPSDELSAIEADLTATNLDSIDADLSAISAEIEL